MDKEVDGILVAAHELKAPLAVLRQLALSFDEMNDNNERIKSEIIRISERAMKQVNDLVKIRRLEEGIFVMEPVAVRAVCDEVTKELNELFNHNNRSLKVRYSNRSPLVTANKDLLHSVIYNFLVNALHYSNDDTRSELIVKESRGVMKIVVRDYGPSLPTSIWRAIRHGWIEKPTAIAMRPGSSGLGIYIASKFSRYMNAEVGAVRHRDGTSFYVNLPISKQASLFEL